MVDDRSPPARRSVRLPGFDYGRYGAYFVTICAYERRCQFGVIEDGVMIANPVGEIVREEWFLTARLRPELELDSFVLMPNHVHGVIRIKSGASPEARGRSSARARTLSSIVGGFKASVTSAVNGSGLLGGSPTWQRGFYEHIVRSERELSLIRRYIRANPVMWRRDSYLR